MSKRSVPLDEAAIRYQEQVLDEARKRQVFETREPYRRPPGYRRRPMTQSEMKALTWGGFWVAVSLLLLLAIVRAVFP